MKQKIVAFHKDEQDDWLAELACGHTQHTRHNPPWQNRLWVSTAENRMQAIGKELNCLKCDEE
ncbi:MAG: DUF3565 domain-containing protein [Gammaproteobacteria bacterium]|nr:DUF3565 domain-containing protein [Gammaproteobacteria bacterium]